GHLRTAMAAGAPAWAGSRPGRAWRLDAACSAAGWLPGGVCGRRNQRVRRCPRDPGTGRAAPRTGRRMWQNYAVAAIGRVLSRGMLPTQTMILPGAAGDTGSGPYNRAG